jgi:cytochrome c oxidase subunit 4
MSKDDKEADEAEASAPEDRPSKKKSKKPVRRADPDPIEEDEDIDAPEPPEAPAPADAHAAHGHHKPNRKQYVQIFALLAALTVLEVGIAYTEAYIGKNPLIVALIGLAVTKAAVVAIFFMHLKHETNFMRWTVAFPIMFPAIYAFILIAEGAYRAVWGG